MAMHTLADLPVPERALRVHQVELVVNAGHNFRSAVPTNGAHDLGLACPRPSKLCTGSRSEYVKRNFWSMRGLTLAIALEWLIIHKWRP